MADIKPFRNLGFNQEKVDIKKVIMPPYDIIKDKDVDGYYQKDPHNIIRIDKGLEGLGDTTGNNKYTRAADIMDDWIRDNILVTDKNDSFYVYTQEYKLPDGRKKEMTSFFAAVKIEEFDKRIILPHEKTHSGPKVDRLELMRATHANTSPILSMYYDKEKKVHNLLKAVMKKSKPFISSANDAGNKFKMWRVDETGDVKKLQSFFSKKQLFIADGHHRYETAMNYRNEMREKLGAKETPYDRILMCLISMEHSGISILPTHRIFKDFMDFDPEGMEFKKYFTVKKLKNTGSLKKLMMKETAKKIIGIVVNKKAYILELKPAEYKKALKKKEHILGYYMLSVSILHTLIFGIILKLQEKDMLSKIIYTQDMDEAINSVIKEGHKVTFMVQPSTVAEVKEISLNKEVMPQKSTYFLPKLITGLLINKMK